MFIEIVMNDKKRFTIENLLYETNFIDILCLLNMVNNTNYNLCDIIKLELIDCSNLKSIPKRLYNLKSLRIINCKNIKKIPNLPSLKQIEFVKPRIIHYNHKKPIH